MNFTDQDVQKQKSAILKLSRKKLRSPCIISEYLDDKYPYIQKNSIEVLKSIYKKDFGYNIKYMVNPSNPLDTVYGDFMNEDYYRLQAIVKWDSLLNKKCFVINIPN